MWSRLKAFVIYPNVYQKSVQNACKMTGGYVCFLNGAHWTVKGINCTNDSLIKW